MATAQVKDDTAPLEEEESQEEQQGKLSEQQEGEMATAQFKDDTAQVEEAAAMFDLTSLSCTPAIAGPR